MAAEDQLGEGAGKQGEPEPTAAAAAAGDIDSGGATDNATDNTAPQLRIVTLPETFVLVTIAKADLESCCSALLQELFRPAVSAAKGVAAVAAAGGGGHARAADTAAGAVCAFFSFIETADEVSIILHDASAACFPSELITQHHERWCVMQLTLASGQTESGVLSRLTTPLAAAGISLFAVTSPDVLTVMIEEEHAAETESILQGLNLTACLQ